MIKELYEKNLVWTSRILQMILKKLIDEVPLQERKQWGVTSLLKIKDNSTLHEEQIGIKIKTI